MRTAGLLALLACAVNSAESPNWVAAWGAAPADAGALTATWMAPGGMRNRTIRNIVHLSVGGSQVRVRLSNALGSETLVVDEVGVGIQQRGASLAAKSTRAVTFGDSRRIAIPAGATALSDPVALAVTAGQNLAVSIFSAATTGTVTYHPASFQESYNSMPGDFTAREDAAPFTGGMGSWLFLSAVDVLAGSFVKGAIVAMGDSITDGDKSTKDANQRWPDHLARRMQAQPGPAFAVVNEGIGGNRLLTNSTCFGPGALARLDRDVFSQSGVRAVILLEGINDFLHPDYANSHGPERGTPCLTPVQAGADDIIAAYRQIAAQTHARGLKIYSGTLLPVQGFPGWTQASEAKRQTVNRWIKTSGAFDGVIDFAAAVADPANPLRLARSKDSGDHVHPNDSGYAAMADAIDLAMLRRGLP